MYTYVAVFTFWHPGYTYVYVLHARLHYNTCPSLLGHGSLQQPVDRPIDQYVRTRKRLEWQRYLRFDKVGLDC